LETGWGAWALNDSNGSRSCRRRTGQCRTSEATRRLVCRNLIFRKRKADGGRLGHCARVISAIVNPVQRFRTGMCPLRAASRSGSSFWLESGRPCPHAQRGGPSLNLATAVAAFSALSRLCWVSRIRVASELMARCSRSKTRDSLSKTASASAHAGTLPESRRAAPLPFVRCHNAGNTR